MVIIDAWMQHPSAEFLADPMFDSLRRWARGQLASGEVPVEATVAAMDAAGDAVARFTQPACHTRPGGRADRRAVDQDEARHAPDSASSGRQTHPQRTSLR